MPTAGAQTKRPAACWSRRTGTRSILPSVSAPAPIQPATRSTASRSGSTISKQAARFQTSRSTGIAAVVPAIRCATWRSRTASSSRPSTGALRHRLPSWPPDCADDVLAASTNYWVIFSDMDHVEYDLESAANPDVHDYGSGWTLGRLAREEPPTCGLHRTLPISGAGSGRRRTRCGHCVDTRLLPQRTG